MSEKTILLLHNEFKIEVEIPNNYNEVNEVVRKALFLKPEEMAKLTLMYKDEEGDNNPLDEDSFEDAFKAKEWCTRPNQDDDDDNEIKEKDIVVNGTIRKKLCTLCESGIWFHYPLALTGRDGTAAIDNKPGLRCRNQFITPVTYSSQSSIKRSDTGIDYFYAIVLGSLQYFHILSCRVIDNQRF